MAICACMGRQGNDPLCPCAMRAAGLTPTVFQWPPEDRERLKAAMQEILEREQSDMRANA